MGLGQHHVPLFRSAYEISRVSMMPDGPSSVESLVSSRPDSNQLPVTRPKPRAHHGGGGDGDRAVGGGASPQYSSLQHVPQRSGLLP
jgi:hypothetical protein